MQHCVLVAKAMGPKCYDLFMDEPFLVDRTTTIREYLEQNPHIMETELPPELAEWYGG